MSEVSSWFRIYEMSQFNAFHMYGVIGSAVFLIVIITFSIKKLKIKSVLDKRPTTIPNKENGCKRYLYESIIFGGGWAISGTCPSPMYSNLGAGFLPIIGVIFAAIFGTFVSDVIQPKLLY